MSTFSRLALTIANERGESSVALALRTDRDDARGVTLASESEHFMARTSASRLPSFLWIVIAVTLLPSVASASSISIYTIPLHNTHQDHLCIFAGTSSCPQDPAAWPAPAIDTNGNFAALSQAYTGSTLTAWNGIVGSSFVLGWDVNSSSAHQTLTDFTITMTDALNNVLAAWTFPSPLVVPDVHNGEGWADYVLAAGCAGSTFTTSPWPIASCTQYLPFVVPVGTTRIAYTFSLGTTGNDGHDDIFAIPYTDHVVPEPASLLLVGMGLLFGACSLRRRR